MKESESILRTFASKIFDFVVDERGETVGADRSVTYVIAPRPILDGKSPLSDLAPQLTTPEPKSSHVLHRFSLDSW